MARGLADLYRIREKALLFGVCMGLADQYQLPLAGVRVVALGLLVAGNVITTLGYLLLTFTTSYREIPLAEMAHEQLPAIAQSLANTARRIGAMEHYLTSDRFSFRRRVG